VKVKRHRTVDCVVIGLAGDAVNPALVLGLRHADGILHHLGRRVGVMCHLERTQCVPLEARQSLFRRRKPQQQGGVF
jgi:hypothetical protein